VRPHDPPGVADIWHSPTDDGWLYLAVVLDLFSRKVVGWATCDLFATIEGTYTRRRLHSALGTITPEQAEPRAA